MRVGLLAIALALFGSTQSVAAQERDGTWIGTWAAAPQPYMPGTLETFRNQTLRLIVHTSAGGARLRIRLSNAYGDKPLIIGGAHVARRAAGADVDPSSDRVVTFAHAATVTIAKGSAASSDAVDLAVAPISDLAISLYLPGETQTTTNHLLALQSSYASAGAGDFTASATFPAAKAIESWPFLIGVDVDAGAKATAIVAFGDSKFDGDGSTPGANHRWPDILAERLRREAKGATFAVLNEGLIGNRLLKDSPRGGRPEIGGAFGQSGLTRFERDALEQPGVAVVIASFGANDLGLPGSLTPASDAVTAADLIAGYRKLAAGAHRRGLRLVAITITPFEDAKAGRGYYTVAKEAVRRAVNAWIRQSRELDGFIDFDVVLRDPGHPSRLLPGYDSGDHLHPNDAGYAAAANGFPLSVLGIR